ncbi:hypothetical protein NDU88_004676 [Pleurodeles waltl]|uniref:Uncharacterized protein n=1 Tax=Pleurodeles waltl TaxID=8319 RepID=A0AAV7TS14_PLEWA|nr:hypothetical protein NDU88_004676 [Pleurodeles waltl]
MTAERQDCGTMFPSRAALTTPWLPYHLAVNLAINTFRRITLMLCSLKVQELGGSLVGYFTPASGSEQYQAQGRLGCWSQYSPPLAHP